MKHWLIQAARIDPYSHKVVWRATDENGKPITKTAPPDLARRQIMRSQRDGTQGDGCIHTWLVLDKEHEVPDDMRGTRRNKFKPVSPPREPEIYTDDTESVNLMSAGRVVTPKERK